MKKAIVLLSGGLDSATALGIALSQDRECLPLAFDYAQRHRRELNSSSAIVSHYASRDAAIYSLKVVSITGLDFDTSALTSKLEVPTGRDEAEMASSIPVTYVPARNSIFLSIAMAHAEAAGADEVWTGFNVLDYSGYPDCRPEYVNAMQHALGLGTARGVLGNPVAIMTPIIGMTKAQIVEVAMDLAVPLKYTWSCYVGQDKPCGACDSCKIRTSAFEALGMKDPANAA